MQISSLNPGAHVVLVGGAHGNEPAGVKAIVQRHRAFRNGEIALNQGKISFLLGNPKSAKDDHGYHIAPQDCQVAVPSLLVKPTDEAIRLGSYHDHILIFKVLSRR